MGRWSGRVAARRRDRSSGARRTASYGWVGDGGSAAVEFALMSVLLVMTLFAVIQVALYFYLRNVIGADTAASARFAAPAGVSPAAAVDRVKALVAANLSDSAAAALTCTAQLTVDAPSGLPVVTVRCQGPISSVFLPIGALLHVDVTASALREGPA